LNEDKAARYHRLKRRSAAGAVAVNALVLVTVLATGGATRLRDAAMHVTGGSPSSTPVVAISVALLALLQGLVTFPLAFYDGFLLERRYGLSAGSQRAFVADTAKALALNLLLALVASQVLYATMRFWPRAWWLASAVAIAVGIAALAVLAPVLLLPLFYSFKPLDRLELRRRLTMLSTRAGVRVLGVYEWGLGEKTRRANAALVGSGRTRRVLVSDTLLADYSDDEIEVILAHELGHHAHRDMLTVLGLESTLIAVALGLAAAALQAAWQPLGLAGPSDVAGLPLLLLAAGASMLAGTPVVNLLSRHHERRADRFALALTGRPAAFVSALRRLGAQNLAESNPSPLALWLFYSHPPIEQRIAAAREYERAQS
jgi:Zn-dependent protease with chaperone function